MIKVGVVGVTGLTGETLTKILLAHPGMELTYLGSEHAPGMEIAQACPSLKGLTDLRCEAIAADKIAQKTDLVFIAKPHRESLKIVPQLLSKRLKVIDLSADFRLKDYQVYEKYYGVEHSSRDLLKEAVYGLPELYRQQLRGANLVANPGCYPTAIILALAPLLVRDLIFADSIMVDSFSGISGSGRTYNPQTDNLFVSCYGNIRAYAVGTHRHTPEAEQELSNLAKKDVRITFVPHLVPIDRGIHTTIFAKLKSKCDTQNLLQLYKEYYAAEPFVRVFDEVSDVTIDKVTHTNFCDIGVLADAATQTVVIISALDNLGKGASSQAVQNMNVVCGFDESIGLRFCHF